MYEFAGLAVLGFVVGGIGTLVGAGGGFLLVPVLLFLYPATAPTTITAISLFVVWANATSGSAAYAWQRRIDYRSGGWFALATLPGAVLGALIVEAIPRRQFDIIFAVALALVGTWLILPRPVEAIRAPLTGWGVVHRDITDRAGHRFLYSFRLWQGMVISLGVGFLSSLLGIGGGIVHVPAMAILLHFPVHLATATSHFVLAFMALEATGVHVATGALRWDRDLGRAVAIGVGAIAGAQLGARFAARAHGEAIIRTLGVALVLVAVRLFVGALF